MFTLQIIENNDPLPAGWLEPFKQYASVPDDGRDAMLLHLLKSAILRVQEYADRAILRCRVRQTGESDPETGLFRLYLGGENDTELAPAALQDYCVKDPNGNYCKWNAQDQKFESLGETNYGQLSDKQKLAATFQTSFNGAISKIPAEYRTVNEFITATISDDYRNVKSAEIQFGFETKYTAGETVYLIFGIIGEKETEWIVSKAGVLENGSVSVELQKDQLDKLAGKPFALVAVSKQ